MRGSIPPRVTVIGAGSRPSIARSPPMTTTELLIASRAAHLEYRRLADQRAPEKRAAMQRAADLLRAAHTADPSRQDAGWPHVVNADHLLMFYAQQGCYGPPPGKEQA